MKQPLFNLQQRYWVYSETTTGKWYELKLEWLKLLREINLIYPFNHSIRRRVYYYFLGWIVFLLSLILFL